MTNTDTAPLPTREESPLSRADDVQGKVHDAGVSAAVALSAAKETLTTKGGETVDGASTTAGGALQQVAHQLRQAGDNLGEDMGWAKQAFSQGADGFLRASGYLTEGRLDDFVHDLRGVARSRPGAFLAGSVAIGFLAARVAKTAVERVAAQPAAEARTSAPSDGGPRADASAPGGAADISQGGS